MTGNREAHLFPLVGFHQREAKNVRSVWAQDRSGLGFPLHGTAETQLIDALKESYASPYKETAARCGPLLITLRVWGTSQLAPLP